MAENKTFTSAVQSHITEKDGELRFKLSPEAINMINRDVTFDTIEVGGNIVTAKAIDYAAALEHLAHPAETPATYEIVADEIHFVNLAGEEVAIPCTVAKVTNICTSQIAEATVAKVYGGCQFQRGKQGAEFKTSVRSDSSISGIDFFTKAEKKADVDYVVKRCAGYDVGISATISPQDMKQLEYFQKLVLITQHVKQIMVLEYLQSIKGSADDVKLAAYKNINRTFTDQLFDSIYTKNIGAIDARNAADAHEYFQTYQDFQTAMLASFPYSASAETIQFGLSARKMVIAREPQWTNMEKVNRVKQFSSGSYFVSSNIDIGIMRIPTTRDIVARHAIQIDLIVKAAMTFVENEARLQAGYSDKAKALPELTDVEAPTTLKYADALGITATEEEALQQRVIELTTKTAEEVCAAKMQRRHMDSVAAINNMFGGK